MMKVLIRLVLVFCISVQIPIHAQKWEFQSGVAFQPNFTDQPRNVWNGMFVSTSYLLDIVDQYKGVFRLEFQSNAWGNHILPAIGWYWRLHDKERWNIHLDLSVGVGVGLYSPRPLFSSKQQMTFFFNYKTKNDREWGIGLGYQWVFTPRYMTYSDNFQALNLPLVVRWGI